MHSSENKNRNYFWLQITRKGLAILRAGASAKKIITPLTEQITKNVNGVSFFAGPKNEFLNQLHGFFAQGYPRSKNVVVNSVIDSALSNFESPEFKQANKMHQNVDHGHYKAVGQDADRHSSVPDKAGIVSIAYTRL